MVFALIDTKVSDISCGSYHNFVVGTPRSTTAPSAFGLQSHQVSDTFQHRNLPNLDRHGADRHNPSSNQADHNSYQKFNMVFSWGLNTNHQLGLFLQEEDQPEVVPQPQLVEELLQYSHIRKLKCEGNKTMVLVDEPNRVVVFASRQRVVR